MWNAKEYTTTHEISYIEGIGTFGNAVLSKKKMLKNYIEAAHSRENWEDIDKSKVLAFARRRLRVVK